MTTHIYTSTLYLSAKSGNKEKAGSIILKQQRK